MGEAARAGGAAKNIAIVTTALPMETPHSRGFWRKIRRAWRPSSTGAGFARPPLAVLGCLDSPFWGPETPQFK